MSITLQCLMGCKPASTVLGRSIIGKRLRSNSREKIQLGDRDNRIVQSETQQAQD